MGDRRATGSGPGEPSSDADPVGAGWVGVDAGGSTARAVLLDGRRHVRARVSGPGSVLTERGAAEAADAVVRVVERVVAEAGLTPPVEGLWVGWAGAGREAARRAGEEALHPSSLARVVRVGTDAEAAFESAFGAGPGLLLVAGTGSVGVGRGPASPLVQVGGWGSAMGDDGSAWWIVSRALRALARAEDGRGAPTELGTSFVRALGLGRPRDLIGWLETATKAEVSALCPLVFEAGDRGDTVAASIVTDAALALRDHAIALLERVGGPTRSSARPWSERRAAEAADVPRGAARTEPLRLALWGALIDERGPLRPALRHVLGPLPLELHDGHVDAAEGAGSLARALTGG